MQLTKKILAPSIIALLTLLASAAAFETSVSQFESLGELETALAGIADTQEADAVWARITAAGTMPLVFGQTAVFLYRGEADSVEWRGDFSSWQPGWDTRGERVGHCDIWRKSLQLLPRSRLDYKIVVNGDTWLFDPLNSHRQAGGSGANSEARMPGWRPSPLTERKPELPRGDLTPYQVIDSQQLGYAVRYRVYTPPGLDKEATDLASLYVTDGPDYYRDDWGAMLTIMDNLYAEQRIRPVITVFISQWNLDNTENRRGKELVPAGPGDCDFCDFIVEELVPLIEANYPVSRSGQDRAILGTSLGGLFSTYMALWHSNDFGRVAIQSPAYHYPPGHFIFEALLRNTIVSRQVFLNVGLYEREFMGPTIHAAKRLHELGVDLRYIERPDGHSWGHWRTVIDDALLFFYGSSAPTDRDPASRASETAIEGP